MDAGQLEQPGDALGDDLRLARTSTSDDV